MKLEIVRYITVGKKSLLGLVDVRIPDWGITLRRLRHVGSVARGENVLSPRTFVKSKAGRGHDIRHFDFDNKETLMQFQDAVLDGIHQLNEEGTDNGIQGSKAKHQW